MWYSFPPEADRIIDKQDRKILQLHYIWYSCVTLSIHPCFSRFPSNSIWFLITPRVTEQEPQTIMTPLCSGLQLWWSFSAVLKESHSIWLPICKMAHHQDAIYNPWPKSPSCVPLETWMLCFVIKRALEAAIMHLMYNVVAAEPVWEARKKKKGAGSWTTTFGENYFSNSGWCEEEHDG